MNIKLYIAFDDGEDLDDNTNRIIDICQSRVDARNAIFKEMMNDGFAREDEILYDKEQDCYTYDDHSGCYRILERTMENVDPLWLACDQG